MIDPETEYLMNRAKDEAVLAIQAGSPAAADAHLDMAVRYSNKAVKDLVRRPDIPVAPAA
jgi:diphthamide biosynthesis methyltransferase